MAKPPVAVLTHCLLLLPSVCRGSVFGPCFVLAVLSVLSSFAIILMRKRELVTLFVFLMYCELVTVRLLVLCVSSLGCRGLVCGT